MNSSPHGRTTARAPLDIVGGLMLVCIALLALYLVQGLPAATRIGFASGTAPRLFAYGLLLLGAIITAQGFLKEGAAIDKFGYGQMLLCAALGGFVIVILAVNALGITGTTKTVLIALAALAAFAGSLYANGRPSEDRFGLRATFAILGAVLFFGLTIRTLGLFITGIPMVIAASAAAPGFRPVEAAIFGVAITVFCALLFSYTLGQPIPLWPNFR